MTAKPDALSLLPDVPTQRSAPFSRNRDGIAAAVGAVMRPGLALLLALLAAVPVHAQTREEITIEVVNVPVYIYQGTKPVQGLTAANFELLVNGKPQTFDYFDVMDLGEPAARPGAPAGVAEQRRLFLLLFDMTFTSPERIVRGQRAAVALVEQKAPADAFAVARFSKTNGMELLLQFTTEREPILGTILTLRPRTAEIAGAESVMDTHEPAIVATLDVENPGESAGPTPLSEELAKAPIQRLAELGVEGLAEMAEALRKIDGFNKHVILFSEGFRTGGSSRMIPLIEEMQETFQEANTFLHALDSAGLRHSFKAGAGDSLRELAAGTGGQWLHNTNDLAGSLINLSETYRSAYILGFRPRAPRAGHNSIVVRVKNLPRGARVVYRRGFSAGPR